MQLSILIPTLPNRSVYLSELITSLNKQLNDSIEILIDSRELTITTGEKRNSLLEKSTGKYVWFVDDDDDISENAIELILKAIETNPDVIGINGWMTTDGEQRVDWEIRLGHPYCNDPRNGKDYYLRHPNHITPMKREHAIKVKFLHITLGEDYAWAKQLNDEGHLKTQEIIEKPIYHYKYRSHK